MVMDITMHILYIQVELGKVQGFRNSESALTNAQVNVLVYANQPLKYKAASALATCAT